MECVIFLAFIGVAVAVRRMVNLLPVVVAAIIHPLLASIPG